MRKKVIVIGIIILFFIASFASGITINQKKSVHQSNSGTTLYVGGGGPGNYTKIQDAIDNSSNGDTVFVYNGSYPHNVWIDKSITLIGEDKNNTIIEGGWLTQVIIDEDDVIVTGFTVRDSGSYYSGGIHIRYKSSNVTIIGNNLSNNIICGISISGSNNYILNNTIKGNYIGIKLAGDNNTIAGNVIDSNNCTGIFFVWIRSIGKSYDPIYQNNIIKENIIINNAEGIYIERANNSLISNNLIAYNRWTGVYAPDNDPGDEYYSYKNNTKIENNTIIYNHRGIDFSNSNRTTISNNLIALNNRSISLYDCNKSLIYHNNIISNLKPPRDHRDYSGGYKNQWDNGYPSGGNFWSDYIGFDNFSGPNQNISGGDGIGDSPYNISGNENSKDRYPFMEPLGLIRPIANFTYPVNVSPVIFDATSSYDPDGTIISYEWDFGDGSTGNGMITCHKYCDMGTYNVTLTVMDNTGLKDSITKSIDVILSNIPPLKPVISGPNSGKPGVEYDYDFIVTYPDGDEFYLWVEWGDGDNTSWIGPYCSGEPVKLSHIWNETGKYIIKAKLKDFCEESPWGLFEVIMKRNKFLSNSFLLQFLEKLPILKLLFQRLKLL